MILIAKIVEVVSKVIELNPYDVELLQYPGGTKDQLDARSIIFRLADFEGHQLQDTCKVLNCKLSTGKAALDRFHKRINIDTILNARFNKCFQLHDKQNKKARFTGIRDWKLQDINEGSVIKSQQGFIFLVEWSERHGWYIIQTNKGDLPELQGDWFELAPYMQPNLEVIGNIYDNPELIQIQKSI